MTGLHEDTKGRTFIPSKHPYRNSDLVTVSPELIPYVRIFEQDAEDHNVDIDKLWKLESISLSGKIGYKCQGVTTTYLEHDTVRGKVRLQKALFESNDSIGFLFVMYHEFGHWLGLEHDDIHMMKQTYTTDDDAKWVEENWVDLKEEYWTTMKKTNHQKNQINH